MSLHTSIFGKTIGRVLNSLLYLYFIMVLVFYLRTYVNIIQIWVFPYTPIWLWCLIILLTAMYMVAGGFRVVVGMNFWGVLFPSLLILIFFYPFKFASLTELLPLFNHNLKEYWISLKLSLPLFAGIEMFLVYAPFVSIHKHNKRVGIAAIVYTTLLYVLIFIFSVAYFDVDFLSIIEWPTLKLSKTISFRLIERFEYIYVFTWLIVIIGPLCLALWSSSRIFMQEYKAKSHAIVYITTGIVFILCSSIQSPKHLELLEQMVNTTVLSFLFIYLPLLFVVCWIRQQTMKRHNKSQSNIG